MVAKVVGDPGEQVLAFLIGTESSVYGEQTKYGRLYLMEPFMVVGPIGTIPSDGVLEIEARIPLSPAAPSDIHVQALKDSTILNETLTNLEVLKIR